MTFDQIQLIIINSPFYRVAKNVRMPYFIGHFPQKSPIISGSFAKSDLQLEVGLGISRTNTDSQWNPVYNEFHRFFCCGNETTTGNETIRW